MLKEEFCTGYFIPATAEQEMLMKKYLKIRALIGAPSRMKILRQLVRTRPYTRSVYPPSWRVV